MLVGGDEERVALLRFVFHVHHYCVVTAESAAEAERLLVGASAHLLLVLWPLDGARQLLKVSKAIDWTVPVLVVAPTEAFLTLWPEVDAALFRDHCSSADVLDRVKVMTARKPGPRHGSRWEMVDGRRQHVSAGIRASAGLDATQSES